MVGRRPNDTHQIEEQVAARRPFRKAPCNFFVTMLDDSPDWAPDTEVSEVDA